MARDCDSEGSNRQPEAGAPQEPAPREELEAIAEMLDFRGEDHSNQTP